MTMHGLFSLDDLDDAALDRLPFGVVRLDPQGRVERFNQTEGIKGHWMKMKAKGGRRTAKQGEGCTLNFER